MSTPRFDPSSAQDRAERRRVKILKPEIAGERLDDTLPPLMKDILRALQFFRPDRSGIAVVFLLLLGAILLNLLKPWPLAVLVDSVLGTAPLPQSMPWLKGASKLELVTRLSILLLAVHLLQGGISTLQNFLSIRVGLRGLARVRNEVFDCLQRLSMRFHQGSKSGDMIYRATWDTYSFQTLFQQGLVTLTTATVSVVLMAAVMARMNGKLTLVALATVPMLFLSIHFFGRRMTARGAAAQQADSQVSSHIQQSMAALPLIQSYTREEHEAAAFRQYTTAAQDRRMSQHASELLYWLGVSVVFTLGTVAVVWVGGREVWRGHLSIGQLLIFLTYLGQLYEPLNQLSHLGSTLATAVAGTRRVFEIMDAPEDVKELPNALLVTRAATTGHSSAAKAARATGALTFEGVHFSYTPGSPVLQDVNLTVAPGAAVALIGPSGAGKTTLMNLVPRFFDPEKGAIRLDGIDLRELRLKELRSHIAVVLQESIILPATVGENIAYGRPGASKAEIEAAARQAYADRFIEKLPRGYDTPIGEAAARLSVGEKQRLSLARAFLKDAPILLLDEPTSALDAESETLVVASLEKLMQGRTTLMIAHRLSTIKSMTCVVVLEAGRIVESGSPAELSGTGGYFDRVVRGQIALS